MSAPEKPLVPTENNPVIIECRLCRKPKKWKTQYQISAYANEIEPWSKVCKECSAIWELGKKTLAANKADGKDYEAVAYINVPTESKMGDPKGPTEVHGKDIMLAMGGVSLRGTDLADPWTRTKTVETVDITGTQDEKDSSYVSGGGSLRFKAPKARAQAMKRVIAAFYNAVAKARVDGFEEGRNLLLGLASGHVKLDEFSEQADNTRAGRKPRRRGDY